MKSFRILFLLVIFLFYVASCKKKNLDINFNSTVGTNTDASVASLQNLDLSAGELNVIELPSSVDQKIRTVFKWYTYVQAPNGKPIHLLGQDQWTIEQMAYTRSVMEHYLTSIPLLIYGDKTIVANNIADANGAMTMYNTKASNSAPVTGQDLQANETVAIGTPEYLDGSVRNAALEEILHFVHDYGLSKAYPGFQSELETTTINAINNQLFFPWGNLPVADYDNEHLASFNDAYWGATEHGDNSLPYLFLSREACKAGDPLSTSLMNGFLPEYFASTVYVSAQFSGTFYLTKNPSLRYTSQSQYYKDVQLLGTESSNLYGNVLNNHLTGNTSDNELWGGIGDDILNGAEGNDIAIYNGPSSEYSIGTSNGITTIIDSSDNRDGTDVLSNIEWARFSDQVINL